MTRQQEILGRLRIAGSNPLGDCGTLPASNTRIGMR